MLLDKMVEFEYRYFDVYNDSTMSHVYEVVDLITVNNHKYHKRDESVISFVSLPRVLDIYSYIYEVTSSGKGFVKYIESSKKYSFLHMKQGDDVSSINNNDGDVALDNSNKKGLKRSLSRK
jgi:hypothetical protein